jgi:hypothetical protein
MTVDQDFSLRDMAWQFRGLRANNLTFVTTPNKGAQTINGSSVVPIDKTKASELFQAVTDDKVADWVAGNQTNSADRGR